MGYLKLFYKFRVGKGIKIGDGLVLFNGDIVGYSRAFYT